MIIFPGTEFEEFQQKATTNELVKCIDKKRENKLHTRVLKSSIQSVINHSTF